MLARLLRELRLFAQQTIDQISQATDPSDTHLAHIVLASDGHVFNLGGDLDLFSQLIRARDRDGLLRYARGTSYPGLRETSSKKNATS